MPRPAPRNRAGQRPGPTRRLAIAGTAAVVVLGGAAAAYAADSPDATGATAAAAASASPSASASASGTTAGRPPAPPRHRPHLDGVVIARNGSRITITDPKGFRRTLRVTGATRYTGGLTSTIAIGTRIHTEGAVDADHTTLDAPSIGNAPTPLAGGPGARPGRGPHDGPGPAGGGPAGGPAGGRGRPAPPAAPSPKPTASASSSASSTS